MSTEQSPAERSTLDKKQEWGGALVGHHHHHHHLQNTHFLHHQQQNTPQTPHAYAHHPQLAGGCATFQLDAGITSCTETEFDSPNSTIDAHGVPQACNYNTAVEDAMCRNRVDVGATHTHPTSAPQERYGMLSARDISTKDNHASSANIATESMHQARRGRDHAVCIEKGNLPMSSSVKMPVSRRTRNASMSPLMVRPTGTKDRHSKVRTAKGLRDRRVRLSAPTAIQFFDVQDRLGYDQPSKAVDWLIKKARAAIDELAPVEGVIVGGDDTTDASEQNLSKDHHHGSFVKMKDEEQSIAVSDVRAESRAKARVRARERAKEKGISSFTPSASCAASGGATANTSAATMPTQPFVAASVSANVHHLPECFLLSSHLRQQFDDPHHTSDLSSMLSQPSSARLAPHLIHLPSHFFPSPPPSSAAASFVYPGDMSAVPSHFSAPPIYANNTPISPRGTLQSIFSNPANSLMQTHMHMPPLNMMMGALQQVHAYGAMPHSIREDDGEFQQRSAELGSPDLHQHSRIPMRIRGMELDSHAEETRITSSSMQADFQ